MVWGEHKIIPCISGLCLYFDNNIDIQSKRDYHFTSRCPFCIIIALAALYQWQCCLQLGNVECHCSMPFLLKIVVILKTLPKQKTSLYFPSEIIVFWTHQAQRLLCTPSQYSISLLFCWSGLNRTKTSPAEDFKKHNLRNPKQIM